MGTGEFNAGGNPVMDQQPIQGGVQILPSHFMPDGTWLVCRCYLNLDRTVRTEQESLQDQHDTGKYPDEEHTYRQCCHIHDGVTERTVGDDACWGCLHKLARKT